MQQLQDDDSEQIIQEAAEVVRITDRDLPLCFTEHRHTDAIQGIETIKQTWRMKERMKTVSVALVLCLNVGVDPPGIVKTQPCARFECWVDPTAHSPQKALELIGCALQKQYERWQPRARYKQSLDPTAEDVKKLCTSLRRNAKEERVLFHYNGHGVPKPTTNGEIWVFNKKFTQYIPLSIYELQTWMGAPSIYVYDCSNAGIIVDSFKQFALQHANEMEGSRGSNLSGTSYQSCIQLAACSATQILPMNPDLPADLFTACLTTPIKVALRWFVHQNTSKLVPKVTLSSVDKIPGTITERRTMVGELNWIFTAITDTIAWNTLPRDLFQKLFRQDLLVASLFRNFLLAERIMRSCDCTPISSPALPPTYQHPMWQAWDLALDLSLAQLPRILDHGEPFKHLPFFEEQLTAFQVWLELGSERRQPPEQLPIVLQVLLSQVHRMRALELLGRFLDLGPWAVNLALSVGIFPYVLKLLQSSAKELRPLLVFIWAKILAVDNTCQSDLVRDGGHKYFLSVLQDTSVSPEHRTQAAFALACIVNDYRDGQEAAVQGSLISICLEQLSDNCSALRQWVAICLGRLWDHYEQARWTGVRDTAHEKLYTLLLDVCPEVRAAAVYALGTYINSVGERSTHANNIDTEVVMTLVKTVASDMSPMVRRELVAALQWLVIAFEGSFVNIAAKESAQWSSMGTLNATGLSTTPPPRTARTVSKTSLRPGGDMKRVASSSSISGLRTPNSASYIRLHVGACNTLPSMTSYSTVFSRVWECLCQLDSDPYVSVQQIANTVTNHIRCQIVRSTAAAASALHSSMSGAPAGGNGSGYAMDRPTSGGGGGSSSNSSSYSLPPSPNRPSYMAESPPAVMHHSAADLHKLLSKSGGGGGSGNRGGTTNRPNTITEEDDILHYHPPHSHQHSRALSSSALSTSGSGSASITAAAAQQSDLRRNGLVSTQYLAWASGVFARPVVRQPAQADHESRVHYEREWRYLRNAAMRSETVESQRRAPSSRLESQAFSIRCQIPPGVIQFHPYDQQIAVAGRDTFSVWDWGTGAKLMSCYCGNGIRMSSSSSPTYLATANIARITALEWVNGFDLSMIVAGLDDGTCKLYRQNTVNGTGAKDMSLVTAWQAHDEMSSRGRDRGSLLSPSSHAAGVLVTWEQYTQTIITGGDSRVLRFWDAERELRAQELPTGSDGSVTCVDSVYANVAHERIVELVQSPRTTTWSTTTTAMMTDSVDSGNNSSFHGARNGSAMSISDEDFVQVDSTQCGDMGVTGGGMMGGSAGSTTTTVTPVSSGLVVAGFDDGKVKVFDRRCAPQDARVCKWSDHTARVLAVQLKAQQVVTGSTSGDVKIFDLRNSGALSSVQVFPAQTMTSLAIHRFADIYACGSSNQTIAIHNLKGKCLNMIKFYEGFINYRIGPVSCLAFHPHRVALGAGTMDCSVSVYTSDARR